jgi:4-amino-4-deoxychorismate lyase
LSAALWNGQAASGESLLSRGLHYGDGVFRTMLAIDGEPRMLDRHLEALERDALQLRMQPPPGALLAAECRRLAAGHARVVLKLMLLRKAGGRGYRPDHDDCDRLLLLSEAPQYPPSFVTQGIRAFRSPVILAQQPLLAGAKHLNRLEQVLASRDWPDGVDEGILCDAEGHAVCGTRSNLFWVRDGRLGTSPLGACGVRGVMRHRILELARQQNLNVELRDLSWTALQQADEVFVSNSLIGLWPVRSLGDRMLAAPGAVTSVLLQALSLP